MDGQTVQLTAVVALIVTLGPVIYWLVDLVIDLRVAITEHTWNGACTKLLAVALSFGLTNLVAHSGVSLGDQGNPLEALTWQALLLACLVFAATGGILKDVVRARNPSDDTVKAKLLKKT